MLQPALRAAHAFDYPHPLRPYRPGNVSAGAAGGAEGQIAAGYVRALAGDSIDVYSVGSQPGNTVNPAAVTVMTEEGIDLSTATLQILTTDAVRKADVVITMGCGDGCPIFPASDTRTGSSPTPPASPSMSYAKSATTLRVACGSSSPA